jgi:hypothetical protein
MIIRTLLHLSFDLCKRFVEVFDYMARIGQMHSEPHWFARKFNKSEVKRRVDFAFNAKTRRSSLGGGYKALVFEPNAESGHYPPEHKEPLPKN